MPEADSRKPKVREVSLTNSRDTVKDVIERRLRALDKLFSQGIPTSEGIVPVEEGYRFIVVEEGAYDALWNLAGSNIRASLRIVNASVQKKLNAEGIETFIPGSSSLVITGVSIPLPSEVDEDGYVTITTKEYFDSAVGQTVREQWPVYVGE